MPISPLNDRRLLGLGVGLLAGAVAGAAWASRARPALEQGTPTLIDWERVRSVATRMNRQPAAELANVAAMSQFYSDLVSRCIPLISEFTEEQLPREQANVYVFGRNDWVRANIDTFRQLFEPVEEINRRSGGLSGLPGSAVWSVINQTLLSSEIGILLGYLARRVLGQYDLALLGKEPIDGGKLYFVEPNIQALQRQLDLPGDDFRMWVALHETTHAFEFEAHPWLQQRFNELLTRYFRLLEEDLSQLKRGVDAVRLLIDRIKVNRSGGERWIAVIMTPEQQAIFNELQAIMCILEGYSNYVMNGIGRQLLPGYDRITARLNQRQKNRGLAEQIFIRLTGLDMKLEQYVLGERFIDTVVAQRGKAFVAHLWTSHETMPTMAEIRAPEDWLRRMEGRGAS